MENKREMVISGHIIEDSELKVGDMIIFNNSLRFITRESAGKINVVDENGDSRATYENLGHFKRGSVYKGAKIVKKITLEV